MWKQTYSVFFFWLNRATNTKHFLIIVNYNNMAEKTKHPENKFSMIFYKILILQDMPREDSLLHRVNVQLSHQHPI
jgi:hypothetical protein